MLKPGQKAYEACWPSGLWKHNKTETDLKIKDEGKEDQGNSQKIKLNNFTVTLWDKRKEILNPISTATEALTFLRNPMFILRYRC